MKAVRITIAGGVALLCCFGQSLFAQSNDEFFETQIRPVLVERCFDCHGREQPKGGLKVDSRDALTKGGESGAAIVPGKAEESLLIQAIRHSSDGPQMPPKSPLPQSVVDDFVRWVNDGATWPAYEPVKGGDPAFRPKHWAFEPMKKVQPPEIAGRGLNHPIDRFIADQWTRKNLQPVAAADARTLVRRLYFDLIGLPPSVQEMEQSVAALTPFSELAWSSLVDRLLDSPRYGERWGRHWLDVVRYADTAGDNADYPVPESMLYRDYVIDSFNADKPYDEFVREQIAGDILADEGLAMIVMPNRLPPPVFWHSVAVTPRLPTSCGI